MDEILYERELMGRLVGEKLTPSQFELLTGRHRDGTPKSTRFLAKERQNFET